MTKTKTKAKVENAGDAGTSTKQGNAIVLESGERRVDYIRRRYAEGCSRGEIAKELNVPYQIVFAATKQKKGEDQGESDAD